MEEDLLVSHVQAIQAAVPDAKLTYAEVIAILQAICALNAEGQPAVIAACALINAQAKPPQENP